MLRVCVRPECVNEGTAMAALLDGSLFFEAAGAAAVRTAVSQT